VCNLQNRSRVLFRRPLCTFRPQMNASNLPLVQQFQATADGQLLGARIRVLACNVSSSNFSLQLA
jgi:hypothetical protein